MPGEQHQRGCHAQDGGDQAQQRLAQVVLDRYQVVVKHVALVILLLGHHVEHRIAGRNRLLNEQVEGVIPEVLLNELHVLARHSPEVVQGHAQRLGLRLLKVRGGLLLQSQSVCVDRLLFRPDVRQGGRKVVGCSHQQGVAHLQR